MSVERFFSTSESQQRLRAGPLHRAIDGFAAWLAIEGYAYRSAAAKLRFVGNLSRWLEREELGVEALDDQRVEAFLLARGPNSGRGGKATTGRQLLCYFAAAASSLPPFPVRAATLRSSGSNERTNASSSTSVASVRRR